MSPVAGKSRFGQLRSTHRCGRVRADQLSPVSSGRLPSVRIGGRSASDSEPHRVGVSQIVFRSDDDELVTVVCAHVRSQHIGVEADVAISDLPRGFFAICRKAVGRETEQREAPYFEPTCRQ